MYDGIVSSGHHGRGIWEFPDMDCRRISLRILPGDIKWEKQHSCRRLMWSSPWPWRLRKVGNDVSGDSLPDHQKSGRRCDAKWWAPLGYYPQPSCLNLVLIYLYNRILLCHLWIGWALGAEFSLHILLYTFSFDMKYLNFWKERIILRT